VESTNALDIQAISDAKEKCIEKVLRIFYSVFQGCRLLLASRLFLVNFDYFRCEVNFLRQLGQ
jgi:hypothetical protein